jgi:hypothetical protein
MSNLYLQNITQKTNYRYSRRWKISSGRHAIFKMAATIPHKFNIVRFQCPELIPDIDKFLPVSIFKMAATIPQKINNIIIYPYMKCRWNRTILNLYGIVTAILKMATGEIFRCRVSIRDIIIYLHMKCRWNRTLLNLWGIVAVILKMAIGRNFSMSRINSGNHYLPTYQILMISNNVDIVQNGRHNIAKIQHCSISKVAFNLFFNPVVSGRFGRLHNR